MSGFAKRKKIFLWALERFGTPNYLPDGMFPHASAEVDEHFIAVGDGLIGRMGDLLAKSTDAHEDKFLKSQISDMEVHIENIRGGNGEEVPALAAFIAIIAVSQALLRYEAEFQNDVAMHR